MNDVTVLAYVTRAIVLDNAFEKATTPSSIQKFVEELGDGIVLSVEEIFRATRLLQEAGLISQAGRTQGANTAFVLT